MENVLVNFLANTKDFVSGLGDVGEKTKDANEQMKGLGAEAAIAFAGYTAAIMGTVYAYREQELVGQEVQAILQSTGGVAGVSAAAINEYAESLSKSTTFSKLQVEKGEEILLTFTQIGSSVFPEATKATLDLAQKMGGDTTAAAQLLGRALEDPMAGVTKLTRAGITFTAQQKAQIEQMELGGDMAGAQKIILAQLESQYGGLATAAAGGTGALVQVKNSMEELAVQIGGVFAPYVAAAARGLRDLIDAIGHNELFIDLAAAVLSVGAAMTGAATALVAGAFAFKQITTAIEVARVVTEAFGLSAKVAMGATGVGLILVVGLEIYQHWNVIWPAMQATFKAFVDNIGAAAQGLGKILLGAFSLDIGMIKAGIAQAAQAFAQGFNTIKAALPAATPEAVAAATTAGKSLGTSEAKARQLALMQEEAHTRALQAQALKASTDAIILELEGHTKKVVDLKKQEAATLHQLATSTNAQEKADLAKHLSEIQALEVQANANETKQKQTFNTLKLRQGTQLSTAERATLLNSIHTEQDAKHQNDVDDLNRQIAADNLFLKEADLFGSNYAAINEFMHSKIIEGTSKTANVLEQMTQSSNATLKSIGQGAAAYNIAVKTVQSAEDAYAGMVAAFPGPFGVGAGIAAAAAATAFGVENEKKVLGLASGGLVTGGIPGVDSVPIMGQTGELMSPEQNFEEVVGGVAAQRLGKQALSDMTGSQPSQVTVVIQLKGDAARILQVQAVRDKSMGIYRGA